MRAGGAVHLLERRAAHFDPIRVVHEVAIIDGPIGHLREPLVHFNYTTLGEDQPFEWNIVPLNIYLYGVENSYYRPLVGTEPIKHALEERYREKYLGDYCASQSCQSSAPSTLSLRCSPTPLNA